MTSGVTVTVQVPGDNPDEVPSSAVSQPPSDTPPSAEPVPQTSTVNPLPSPTAATPPPTTTRISTVTGTPQATMLPSLPLTGSDAGLLLMVAVAFLVAGLLALWRARIATRSTGETP